MGGRLGGATLLQAQTERDPHLPGSISCVPGHIHPRLEPHFDDEALSDKLSDCPYGCPALGLVSLASSIALHAAAAPLMFRSRSGHNVEETLVRTWCRPDAFYLIRHEFRSWNSPARTDRCPPHMGSTPPQTISKKNLRSTSGTCAFAVVACAGSKTEQKHPSLRTVHWNTRKRPANVGYAVRDPVPSPLFKLAATATTFGQSACSQDRTKAGRHLWTRHWP